MKNNKLKVLFLAKHGKNGSTIIRANTIQKSLASMGVIASSIGVKKFKYLKSYYLNKYDIFIFIKQIDSKLVKSIKKSKKIVIVDTIDNFNFNDDTLWSQEQPNVDYYIVNTKDHQDFLKETFGIDTDKSFIIPHHHSNLNNISKKISSYKTFGFIGNKNQFKVSEKLMDFFKNKKLDFYISNKSPTTNDDAVRETLKLDCFVTNVDQDFIKHGTKAYEYMLKFKPAQKILLPFSMGIPTVLSPYSSYKEAITEAGFRTDEFLMAANEDELIATLNRFIDFSDDEKNILIEKQKKVASSFTLEKISELYISMFKRIYNTEFTPK